MREYDASHVGASGFLQNRANFCYEVKEAAETLQVIELAHNLRIKLRCVRQSIVEGE